MNGRSPDATGRGSGVDGVAKDDLWHELRVLSLDVRRELLRRDLPATSSCDYADMKSSRLVAAKSMYGTIASVWTLAWPRRRRRTS